MQTQRLTSWTAPDPVNESYLAGQQGSLGSWDFQAPATVSFVQFFAIVAYKGSSRLVKQVQIFLSKPGAQPVVLTFLSLLPFLLTYLATFTGSKISRSGTKKRRRAPLVPYTVPIVGHALWFVWSVAGLIQSNADRYSKYGPVRFYGMFNEICFVSGPKHIAAMFKNSRRFSAKASVVIAMDRLFGTPQHVVRFYDIDNSGIESIPAPGSNIHPLNRIHHIAHVQVIKHLSGAGLKPMTARLMENLSAQVAANGVEYEWLRVDDLFAWCQRNILHASLDAMFGPYLTALNPNFISDYWEFDASTSKLLKGFPRWIVPKPWTARQRCLDSLKRYNAYANKLHDADGRKVYEGIDPFFGSEFIRNRKESFAKMETMNEDAIASEDLAIMWAANSNSIPAAFWYLYEMFRDQDLLARARVEVDACRMPNDDPNMAPSFDVDALCRQPVLQSAYAETVRLRTAILVTRMPEGRDFTIGDWIFPKDKLIMVASQTAHLDEDVWSQGTAEDSHPLSSFWADRFLVYPDQPESGPLKRSKANRPSSYSHTSSTISAASLTLPDATEVKGNTPRFTTEGLNGAWIPYGGGQTLCPGRHFAKQEMIMTFAIFATAFDMELMHEPDVETQTNMKYFGLGVLPPKGKTPVRIRRRRQT